MHRSIPRLGRGGLDYFLFQNISSRVNKYYTSQSGICDKMEEMDYESDRHRQTNRRLSYNRSKVRKP